MAEGLFSFLKTKNKEMNKLNKRDAKYLLSRGYKRFERKRNWIKGKYNSWHDKEGVELTSYGSTTLYPFIQIGKYYDTQKGKDIGYEIKRHGTHTSELLKRTKTKPQAVAWAKSYMKRRN